jgi:predicted  nucleic acid-binding Zn-ribbon protein
MELATVREAVNLTNNTKVISPYTLRQVLESYSTIEKVKELISNAQFEPGSVDLSAYAKKTDLPTKLSQLDNDDNYVQTIDGIIPAQYLPSYVDDVLEYSSSSKFPNPGDSGKIYVDATTNITYRWSGSGYIEISNSIALGTTSTTAFRGDHGLAAYQHISVTGNPHGLTLGDLSITVDANTINYLSGLSENISAALYKKLDTAGGTLSGYLTLHHDPVEKMHAANKYYVDTLIDGVSVSVTQNVTRITEIAGELESQKTILGAQADTLTKVENDVTGLTQTTAEHTEAISAITQDISGISSTVGETKETLTILEKGTAIISATEPEDTSKIWLNITDNKFYRYNENAWIPISDVSQDLLNIQEQLGQIDSSIKDAISENNNELADLYYTKEEVNTTVEQKKSELNIEFTNKVTTLENKANNLEAVVTDMSGYIDTGTKDGKTWLQLGNKASDFAVRIEQDHLEILYKGNPVTRWEQDLFEVETVISKMLKLGAKLGFVVNEDQSVSFRKLSD